MDTRVRLAGLELKNPVMPASGTFGYGMEFSAYGDLASLGALVVKGLSIKPREGNPTPRVAETACGMLNAVGLQNMGAEAFVTKVLPKLPHAEVPVVANLYACDPAEFGDLAAYLAEAGGPAGLAALEVNVSCPNVAQGGVLFGQDPALAAKVTGQVKARAGALPVIVKLSPNVADIAAVAVAVAEAGADAVCCINTLTGMAVDLERRRPRLANVVGGLSGPAIKPVALRCVHQCAKALKGSGTPVIGVGGIRSARDVLEFILVGAHAVQVGTASFTRPDRVFALVDETARLAEDIGLASWDDLRGTLMVEA